VRQAEVIAAAAARVPGVTATIAREPWEDRSNRSPRVTLRWTAAQIGLTGQQAVDLLYNEEPRITVGGGSGARQGEPGDAGLTLATSMLQPGDEAIVGERLHAVLSAKRTLVVPPAAVPPSGDVAGQWRVEIAYVASRSTHVLQLRQKGAAIEGSHQGDIETRELSGTMDGARVTMTSRITERTGNALNYRFTGELSGDTLTGTIDMGEYRSATFTARRVANA
jgi:hypothetical protein